MPLDADTGVCKATPNNTTGRASDKELFTKLHCDITKRLTETQLYFKNNVTLYSYMV
jgi:hypothetical protein